MTFVSIAYLLLLPLTFVLCRVALRRTVAGQNVLLLAASYVFYGWWDWRFLGLLAGLTLTSWACALPRTRRRMWAGVNVAVCIAALIAFKYAGFFAENLRWLFENFGWEMDWFTVEVLLPVGLSFYALQAISYSVDVASGRIEPERNLVTMALYISFFPQLVAGPIEQATSLLPQLKAPRAFDYGQAVEGMRRIVWGFFKKVVVADGVAVWVDHVYNFYDLYDGVTVPFYFAGAAMLFAIQIYADFSGYSDIAIGSAQLLGIRLTDNFLFPFFSRNGRELWSRWHRSLYIWLRTYVYIPLGGSRRGNRYVHVMIVFMLSGLWHGAAWTFVAWGVLCGLWVCLSTRLHPGKTDMSPATAADLPACVTTTMIFATVFIFFRSASIAAAGVFAWYALPGLLLAWAALWTAARVLGRSRVARIAALAAVGIAYCGALILYPSHTVVTTLRMIPLIAIPVMLWVEWCSRTTTFGLGRISRRRGVRATIYLVIGWLVVTGAAYAGSSFIYSKF